jgi:hypothetical protein
MATFSKKTVEFHLDHLYTKIGAAPDGKIWALHHGMEMETREIPVKAR